MREFIKYCFDCLGMCFLAAFGNNTKGMSWADGITGIITFFALTGLLLGILWFVGGIVGAVWAVAIGITAVVATYILWEGVDYLYGKIKEWIFE